ncbi:CHAT domain-containing protein, partial [Micromonospora sp. NPDC049374]|uniref:CHAT domain-containing protein n=1 Tax=Micromonospora sp. NPDC049374 TaxID=3154352 RepID=UPI00344A7E21
LGMTLHARFGRTGADADLDEAVTVLRQALDATPADHAYRIGCLSNLGNALQVRFQHFGTGRDLDEAVTVLRQAADASPAGHPSRPLCLSNLGHALRSRYDRTGSAADLDEAVRIGRQAVEAAPTDHPNRAIYLTNLAVALFDRFVQVEADADLDESIDIARQAVDATPRDHPDRAPRLSNLSLSLETRYEHTGVSTDLEEAVEVGWEAVQATPAGHPNRARTLSNLGAALHTRFTRSADATDLDGAVQAWAQACASTAAPASMRVAAASRWGRAVARARGPAAATEAYAAGIDLLPLMAWRGIDHPDRQHLLETHAASLARDGAACAVDAGRLDLAVELLEHGRGMFWSQLLDTRTDLTALQRADPDLAEQLHRCRAVLTRPVPTGDHHSAPSGETRLRAARRFEELLDLVRALPPTEHLPHPDRFLRPPPVHTLLPEPGQDPTVIVNLSRWRCDALVLTHGGVELVELPDVTEKQVVTEANRYLDALHTFETGRRDYTDRFILEMAITATLEWLWDYITRPILDALGHATIPRDRWPRLWWCPTGALTVLPLHAAGYHHTTNTVHDRVISSYTPTLRALHEARVRPESTQPREILVIAIPETPRREPLRGASIEQDLLCASFPATHRTLLTGPHATHDTVLAEISRHRWLHASCHGTQNMAGPTEGGLLPYDWDTAGPISVTDLTAARHLGGEFAFLSACKTATGGVTTLDEAITVAAAMQHAGWRHVIGTLWRVWDESAATISREVYAHLVRDGHLDPAHAAWALHRAVRTLRDDAPHSPSIWAPFIHAGP